MNNKGAKALRAELWVKGNRPKKNGPGLFVFFFASSRLCC